ncbi:hypothetical protein N2152v2_006022 [Parachlorella kessleri]
MASLEAEDYVLVDKGEAQGLEQGAGLHDVAQRPASSIAPSTPESARAPARPTLPKEAAAAMKQPGFLEVVSAHFIYWLLVGLEEAPKVWGALKRGVVRGTEAARPAAPRLWRASCHGTTAARAAGQQYSRLIRASNWQAVSQLAATHATTVLAQLVCLARVSLVAAKPAYLVLVRWAHSAAAVVIFVIHNPGQAWQAVSEAAARARLACWGAYLHLDPHQELAGTLRRLALWVVTVLAGLYARADPDRRAPRFYHARVYPALESTAASLAAGAHKAQPHLLAAWARAAPMAQSLWAEGKQAWQAPGLGWVFILAGAVALLSCIVALSGAL